MITTNLNATTEDPNATEVVKISTGKFNQGLIRDHLIISCKSVGQLYLVRPGNIRTSRECMCVNHNSKALRGHIYEFKIDIQMRWPPFAVFLPWSTTFNSL